MKKVFKVLLAVAVLLLILLATLSRADMPLETLKQKYVKPPSQFDSLMGMNVHFRDEGSASDSVPLVLLHGTSSSLFTWDACTQEWAKTNRVIRMDLPGFAITGPEPHDNYSLEAYVHFLHKFLVKRGVKSCYLAGNSLGGEIAYAYAAYYPGEVRKLILLDAAGYPVSNAKGSLGFTLARIPVLNHLLTIITPRSVVRKSVEDVYGDKTLVTDQLVDIYEDMLLREGNRAALLKRFSQLRGDTGLVKRVQVPTMVIWGEKDFLIPADNAYKFQRDLSIDTLVILKNVGHLPMEESPGKVISLVQHFIR